MADDYGQGGQGYSGYGGYLPFRNAQVPESVRAQLLADQLIQRSAADSRSPIYHRSVGLAHLGAGLAGGLMEGYTLRKEEAAQAASRATLVNALAAKYGQSGVGGAASPSATPGPQSDAGGPKALATDAQMNGSISPSERDLAIRTIYGEAGGEGADGQIAVANVMRNRLASGNYGGSLSSVITAPNQFSVWNKGDPAGQTARNLDPNSDAYKTIGGIVDGVASGSIPDNTNGADHYYNPHVASPDWGDALGQRNSVTIGNHRFVGGNGPIADAPPRPPADIPNATADATPQGVRDAVTQAFRDNQAKQQVAGDTVPSPDYKPAVQPDAPLPPPGAQSLAQQQPAPQPAINDPSLRDTIIAAMQHEPAAGPVLTEGLNDPGNASVDHYMVEPKTGASNPPPMSAGGLGAQSPIGTMPGPDSLLPGDIPVAASMMRYAPSPQMQSTDAIPNAPPDGSGGPDVPDAGTIAQDSGADVPLPPPRPPELDAVPVVPPGQDIGGGAVPGQAVPAPPPPPTQVDAPPANATGYADVPQTGAAPAALAAALHPGGTVPMSAPSGPAAPLGLPGHGGGDPASAMAFLQSQNPSKGAMLAGLLSGGGGGMPSGPAPASVPPPVQGQGPAAPSMAPNSAGGPPPPANLASAGPQGNPAPGVPQGRAAIMAAMLDPRISDSVKQALFAPVAPIKVGQGETLVNPLTLQPSYSNPAKADWKDLGNGNQQNAVTGEVRPLPGGSAPDISVNRQGIVFDKHKGVLNGGSSAYREMSPQEVQDAGYPPGTHVQIGPTGEKNVVNPGDTAGPQNEFNKQLAGAYAKPQVALMEGVEGARERLRSFNEMSGAIDRLQKNGGTTGMGQDEIMHLQNAINSGASLLGMDQKFDLSDQEVLQKLNKQIASSAAKTMSTRGATNFDFSSFQAANPGLEMSLTGNKRMLGIMSQVEQRNIGVGQAIRDAYGASLRDKKQVDPTQLDQIVQQYDASHHIVDPITGQDITASPKLPDLQINGAGGSPPAPSATPAPPAPRAGIGGLGVGQSTTVNGFSVRRVK